MPSIESSARRRGWKVALLGMLVAGAAAWGAIVWANRPYAELKAAARQIQFAVERYAVDHDGSYPQNLDDVLANGCIPAWPDNPFHAGRMEPLPPGAPWQAGGFSYLPIANMQSEVPKGESQLRWLAPEPVTLQPNEVVSYYALVFYGPRGKPRLRRLAALDLLGLQWAADFGDEAHYFNTEPPGVDWQHASYMVTSVSGTDFV